jgi:hypothetical protein
MYWKLVFFPGILEWVKKRLDDENHSKDHNMYVKSAIGTVSFHRSPSFAIIAPMAQVLCPQIDSLTWLLI